ncbi:hypothetical protein PsorP6_004978 [Peronosclerospora sorghi]|uniref:Uncharacterized protein n=1 Tax=Peronosclerospora sorghi TaxID=230839 RepID=A0ACC0W3I3_9STRA|nr:hypothetical protein PsorP6_004978 [Peronosclerospora sorghi]
MHIKSSEMIDLDKRLATLIRTMTIPRNLLAPERSETMAGGWETAHKVTRPAILTSNTCNGLLDVPGKDLVELKLGNLGVIHQVEVDTNHFKGYFPGSCMFFYFTRYFGDLFHDDKSSKQTGIKWKVVLPRVKLIAHKQHYFSFIDGNVDTKWGQFCKV